MLRQRYVVVDRVKTAVLTSLLVVTLLPACGSTKAPREPAADTEPSYVLVDSGARFYQSPQADAPRQSGSMHPRTGDALTPRSVPVRYEWVADHEGWVEVRPTASEPAHCVGPSRQLQDFDLRLFVKRSALVPVLTATVTVTQPNGTEAAALAGRWLRPGQDEVVETNKRSKVPVAAVRVPLPASAIGFRYQGGALRPTLADWTYYLGPDAIFATDWEPESGFTGDVISVTAGEDADTAVATIRRRCVETTRPVKRVGAPGTKPVQALGALGSFGSGDSLVFGGGTIAFGSSSETPPLPELASGTTLYWLEGPRAGVTTVATTPDIELTSSQSDRRCFGWTTTLMFDKPKAQWPRWSFCVDRDAAR